MSVETVLATAGNDLKSFWNKLKSDVAIGKAVWGIISSPQTRAVLVTLGQQAFTTVKDAAAAVEASGINITLDAVVVADIKTLIADAEAGDGVIVADFKALGILL
jgi:hypothetical protein